MERTGKRVHAQTERLQEVVAQELAGMHRRQPAARTHVSEVDGAAIHVLTGAGHGLFPQW